MVRVVPLAKSLRTGNKYPGLVRTLTLSAQTETVNGTKGVEGGTAVSVRVTEGASAGAGGFVAVWTGNPVGVMVATGIPEGINVLSDEEHP